MDTIAEVGESPQLAPNIKLRKGLNVADLIQGKGVSFEVDLEDLGNKVNKDEQLSYNIEEVHEHLNMGCLDILDEERYDSSPFEAMRSSMVNVTNDGKISKRVLREGVGELLEDSAEISIHYNSYVEFNDEPYDSTYIRKRPHRFRLNNGDILPGLNMAVQTMRRNEKSRFLIHPDYAYGALGCFDRVPANSTILYEIEVIHSTKSLPATDSANGIDENMSFQDVLKTALQLCEKANATTKNTKNYKSAVRDYNQAASRLELCELSNYEEQEEQNKILLRLYINLAVCYNRIQNPQKACINCDKIYRLVKGTSLDVPAKVYFNHAKALMQLNDLKKAERQLRKATKKAQHNQDVVRLYLNLNKMMEEQTERDAAMAKALVGDKTDSPSEELKKLVVTLCEDLNKDEDKVLYNLPEKLSEAEINCIREIVKKYDLVVLRQVDGEVTKYKISKVNKNED